MTEKLAVMADAPSDYERLGLSPTAIAPWEDGKRTDDSAGTYEWWYFDAHLADGATVVASFMNKMDLAAPKSLAPVLRLNLDLPDGRHFEKLVHHQPSEWSPAKHHPKFQLAKHRSTPDLHPHPLDAPPT